MIDLKTAEAYLKKNLGDFDLDILRGIEELKKQYISVKDEANANLCWYFENAFLAKQTYVSACKEIANSEYENAWNDLDRTDTIIYYICENYDLSKSDDFGLLQIRKQVHNLQKLFPYVFFFSRETVIEKEVCSICGRENSLRHHCDHVPCKLYMGEMCMMDVQKIVLKGIAIVRKPFDKIAVLKPKGKEFDYSVLEHILENWRGPYDFFQIKTRKEKSPEFRGVGRNEKCPCGSGKKYKKCCQGTQNELYDFHEAIFSHPIKKVPSIMGFTWK